MGNSYWEKRNGKISEKKKREYFFSGNASSVRILGKKSHGQKKKK